MQPALADGTILQDRYQLLGVLDQGSNGITYAAKDDATGQTVAVKVLVLAELKDWSPLEQFERETKLRQDLDHPSIPRYLDHFQASTDQGKAFCMVQAIAQGKSLAARVNEGWHISETEVQQIARDLLDVLAYLHELHPPIVHRDLTPENIVLSDEGQIVIVDVGAVQTPPLDEPMPGGTIVGTHGYMAPEQFRGAACPASDLYALGGTLLFLLTHRSPNDLPQTRMAIDFRDAVNLSETFTDWLERLLEPMVEDRFVSATDARFALDHPETYYKETYYTESDRQAALVSSLSKPSQSQVQLDRSRDKLKLVIPPQGLQTEAIALGVFVLFWNGLLFFWTFMAVALETPMPAQLLSLPFWGIGLWMLIEMLTMFFGHTELEVDGTYYRLRQQVFGWNRFQEGTTRHLDNAELQTSYNLSDRSVQCIALKAGMKTHKFGILLSAPEKAWLVQELSTFLQQQ